jgi:response regulator NasT
MRNIAIVDDSDTERVVIKGLVEECGFKVVAMATNGAEAVEMCRTNSPELIIMDVKMPVKDGIDAAAEINSFNPTPIVLLTADNDPETLKRAIEAGIMAYLVKPVRMEEIVPAVELAISRFSEFKELRAEVHDLKDVLESRKVIEKAKGLLMAREGLVEAEAFKRIRKISMDKRKTMKEIAEVVILTLESGKDAPPGL